jgi:transcriptional regulator with XRE-family HTH domain
MPVDAHRLRFRRDELGLRNGEVAERADITISPRYVENIMQGRDQPSRRVILALARVLKMPAVEIDPEINAGKRTPHGDPSEPPIQPAGPKAPPRRQDHEPQKGPKRARDGAAA